MLKDCFAYADLKGHQDAFDEYCLAALEAEYNWKRGSPSNGLYYADILELFVEAAYLLQESQMAKYGEPLVIGNKDVQSFIKGFFERLSLARWKSLIHDFTMSAISNGTVIDEIEPTELFLFITQFKNLIEVADSILKVEEDRIEAS